MRKQRTAPVMSHEAMGRDSLTPGTANLDTMVAPDSETAPREMARVPIEELTEHRREAAAKQLGLDEAGHRLEVIEDGWKNLETSMGVRGKDSGMSTHFAAGGTIDRATLEQLYQHEGLARKIVNFKVQEMFRRGFEVKKDPKGLFVRFLKKKRMISQLRKLAYNGRLFGGAVAVVLAADGSNTMDKPLNLRNLQDIDGLNVFDRWQVVWYTDALYTDTNNPKFMTPEYYWIYPIYGTPFKVHESRILRYDGEYLPERQRQANSGWHDSVLQSTFDKLRMMGEVMGYSSAIMRDFILEIFAMDNLSNLIAEGNELVVQKRFEILRRWKSAINTIPIDKEGESFQKSASSVSGLEKLIDQFMQWVCADSGYPYSILFGKGVGGMSGGSETDAQLDIFYDSIAEEQEERMDPLIERLLLIVQSCQKGPFKGVVDEELEADWLPIRTPTQKEMAEIRKANADADAAYLDRGVYAPEEIAQTRSGPGGEFQPITTLFERGTPTAEDLEDPEPEDEPGTGGAPAGKGGKKKTTKPKAVDK